MKKERGQKNDRRIILGRFFFMELSLAEHDFSRGRTVGQLFIAASFGKSTSDVVSGDGRSSNRSGRQSIGKTL